MVLIEYEEKKKEERERERCPLVVMEMVGSWVAAPPTDGGGSGSRISSDRDWLCGSSC